MNLEIIYEDDTELAEFEALNKGYRKDVIIKLGGKKYKVYITSMIRLQQDFETEYQDAGYYYPEPNMVIVKDVTKEEISEVIKKLCNCKFFERLDEMEFQCK